MSRRLRWRVVVTVAVTFGISIFAWYPVLADYYGLPNPDFIREKRLTLGLDLQGGVQMVLRVNTDDAILLDTRNTAGRLEEALTRQGVKRGPIEILGPGRFRVPGIAAEDDGAFRRVSDEVAGDFDRESGPRETYTFTIGRDALASLRTSTVSQARQTVDRRVNALGVAEPLIAIQGAAADEILVQLPGVADMDRARDILGATALLEWKLVERGPAPTREALLDATGGVVPPHTEVAMGVHGLAPGDADTYYLVRSVADITGRDLRDARPIPGENNQPSVAFSLTQDGARRFARLTGENVGRSLAIILDGRVQSAPQIEGRIDRGDGQIRGRFTQQQAADLSLVLRAGALPASMTYLGGRLVGPSLGSASIHAGVVASLAGLGLIAAFMLLYYNRAGINALVSVVVNLLLLLGLMAYSGAVLTLPGIAGLILTNGMGVDSNVLIFERIKEELAAGRRVATAVAAGFNRVFLTILDTHIASLIAAAFLFQFGTGPIRGFATTLTFGLLSNVFTAVFVSRTIFEVVLSRGRQSRLRFETFTRLFRAPDWDFYRWRWHALLLSTIVILTGAGLMVARGGVPLGIDFSGGTIVTVKFAQPVSEELVQNAIPGEETVQRYGEPADHEILIRLPQMAGTAEGATLAQEATRVVAALHAGDFPSFEVTGTEAVGPSIGADLRRKGAYATLASIAGITGYIAFRFRPSFAAGAIAATLHDILVTVSLLSLSGYDLSLNVVAAILTITGYSVNDTIVTFDRVRENLRTTPGASLEQVVNAAVNQTLGRTIITAGTTFLAVLALFIFGGDVLHGFAFAMLVGIVSGTYSTIFIAAAIAVMLSKRHQRGVGRAARLHVIQGSHGRPAQRVEPSKTDVCVDEATSCGKPSTPNSATPNSQRSRFERTE
jgi:protein-export membrane protein SecD/preprotein translocase SecF subunit